MRYLAMGLALAGLTAGAALAAPVNLRQANQQRRIDAGVRSGKLSPGEAARLRGQQAAIEHQEDRMRARHGGHLTARDKRMIHARQDRADAAILQKKNNRIRGRDHLRM